MQDFLNLLSSHIVELAISILTVLVTGVVTYISSAKLKKKDAELENRIGENREQLSRQSSSIQSVLSQQAKSQSLTIELQARAVGEAWKHVLTLRKISEPCELIDRILYPGERKGDLLEAAGGLSQNLIEETLTELFDSDLLEEHRPYLGEDLWSQYDTLRLFSGRSLYYLKKCWNADHPVIWQDDPVLNQIIDKSTLERDVLEHCKSLEMGFIQSTRQELENAVLSSIHKIITGESASKESLKTLSIIGTALSKDEARAALGDVANTKKLRI